MSPVVIALVVLVAASFLGILALIGVRAAKLTRELEEAEHKLEALSGESRGIAAQLAAEQAAHAKASTWLENSEQDANWLRAELARRPKLTQKIYKILTLGVKATGKTSLTLKWSNPLIDLGTLEGTKIERYQRTVSLAPHNDTMVQHIFEVHDWGGEHIVDAQQELIVDEIYGLLLVVDLGGRDAEHVDPSRIQEQLQEFQAQALKYFFGPKTVSAFKTVVLFINKSDLLAGTPAQVEEQAKTLYAPLIENLKKFSNQIDVRVFVGSASYGHSTHLLFSHFVERILPKSAYNGELLQRLVVESSGPRTSGAALQMPAAPTAAPVVAPSRQGSNAGLADLPSTFSAPASPPTDVLGEPAPGRATVALRQTVPIMNRAPAQPPSRKE